MAKFLDIRVFASVEEIVDMFTWRRRVKPASAGGDESGYELAVPLTSLSLMLSVCWDLPEDALVRICVEPTKSDDRDLWCFDAAYHPATKGRPSGAQCLVARAGDWECRPPTRFLRPCGVGAALAIPVGELRRLFKVLSVPALGMHILGGGQGPLQHTGVRLQFEGDRLKAEYCGETHLLPEGGDRP